MIKIDLSKKANVSLLGEQDVIGAEFALGLALWRRLMVHDLGEEEARERYRKIIKTYKDPDIIARVDKILAGMGLSDD